MHEAGVAFASASTAHTRLESRAERRADAMVHVIGVTCGLVACLALAMVASGADVAILVSLVIYGAGLLAMLGCSALCNTAKPGPLKELWRRLDHAAIFVMIAGTYTPFAAIAIGGGWGTVCWCSYGWWPRSRCQPSSCSSLEAFSIPSASCSTVGTDCHTTGRSGTDSCWPPPRANTSLCWTSSRAAEMHLRMRQAASRAPAIFPKLRPSLSRTAVPPLNSCQR
jgi:Haemolysin-III related